MLVYYSMTKFGRKTSGQNYTGNKKKKNKHKTKIPTAPDNLNFC